jgi:hypothetical protein
VRARCRDRPATARSDRGEQRRGLHLAERAQPAQRHRPRPRRRLAGRELERGGAIAAHARHGRNRVGVERHERRARRRVALERGRAAEHELGVGRLVARQHLEPDRVGTDAEHRIERLVLPGGGAVLQRQVLLLRVPHLLADALAGGSDTKVVGAIAASAASLRTSLSASNASRTTPGDAAAPR